MADVFCFTSGSFTYLLFVLRLRWFVCRGLSLSAVDDQLSFVYINPVGCSFVLHVAFCRVMLAAILVFWVCSETIFVL